MDTAMLLLGIVIGCLAGLLLTGWLFRHGGAVEPFFLRLLHRENKAKTRIDTRLMLHELLRKVEDLAVKTQRMDLELQDLKDNYPQAAQQRTDLDLFDKTRPFSQVYRLSQEGLTAEEIACRLQLGRGEVELLLSLGKKPDWVISAASSLNTAKILKQENVTADK